MEFYIILLNFQIKKENFIDTELKGLNGKEEKVFWNGKQTQNWLEIMTKI